MLLASVLSLALLSVPSSSLAADPSLLTLTDAAHATRTLTPSGRPLLVHFWALWCPPCMEELPRQIELARKASNAGADVLFVSVDALENAPAIRAKLSSLNAYAVARQAHMDMKVDVDAIARALDKDWDGSLPATFAVVGSRTAFSLTGELGPDDEKGILLALKPVKPAQPPRVPAKNRKP
ncbi:MAG: TlpA disulfide reductase family protein [Myxococcaceae bacterium]